MSGKAQTYLAVDLGAESGRVIAGRFDGRCLQLETLRQFPNRPVEAAGHLHWQPFRLFEEIKTGMKLARQTFGDALVSVGVDTWGVDYGLLDANDQLLHPPFHYRDARNKAAMERALEIMPRDQVYQRTGLQFMMFNTLFQLQAEHKEALAKARALLFMPDLLSFWLSGRKINESTIASTSQLLNPYTGDWHEEILKTFGLPRSLFQNLTPPATEIAPLVGDVVRETGCEGIKVISVGGHDTASAVAAVPFEDPEDAAYLSSGTWSLLGIESAVPLINERSFAFDFTNEWGLEDTFRVLKNISGLWIVQECRRAWAAAGEDLDYEQLTQLARQAPPFCAVIDVDDGPFLEVGNMPEKIAEYCRRTGQAVPQDKSQIVRIATEGLALKYAKVLEQLEALKGGPVHTLHIVGGGTQNDLLNQLAADACGRTVVTGPVEGTAAGNVIAQMIAQGELSSVAEGRQLVRQSFDLKTYQPKDAEGWSAAGAKLSRICS
jgi:rhamnulokinase